MGRREAGAPLLLVSGATGRRFRGRNIPGRSDWRQILSSRFHRCLIRWAHDAGDSSRVVPRPRADAGRSAHRALVGRCGLDGPDPPRRHGRHVGSPGRDTAGGRGRGGFGPGGSRGSGVAGRCGPERRGGCGVHTAGARRRDTARPSGAARRPGAPGVPRRTRAARRPGPRRPLRSPAPSGRPRLPGLPVVLRLPRLSGPAAASRPAGAADRDSRRGGGRGAGQHRGRRVRADERRRRR
ncbi:hypothetical protein SGPA1_10340 [Streptomyces misionensis JCM 4497]